MPIACSTSANSQVKTCERRTGCVQRVPGGGHEAGSAAADGCLDGEHGNDVRLAAVSTTQRLKL
jgi:hypothetical protein